MHGTMADSGARSGAQVARALLVAPWFLVLLGCSDSGTGPSPCAPSPPRGTMTAQVNGAAFTANAITLASIRNSTPQGPNTVSVHGMACVDGTANTDKIYILVQRQTPITVGTYELSAAAQGQPAGSGYVGVASYTPVSGGAWYSTLSDAAGQGSGSITFTSVTATRVAGTFSVVLVASSANAAGEQGRVTITNGTFDMPVQ